MECITINTSLIELKIISKQLTYAYNFLAGSCGFSFKFWRKSEG
jgi:hypothetical protein